MQLFIIFAAFLMLPGTEQQSKIQAKMLQFNLELQTQIMQILVESEGKVNGEDFKKWAKLFLPPKSKPFEEKFIAKKLSILMKEIGQLLELERVESPRGLPAELFRFHAAHLFQNYAIKRDDDEGLPRLKAWHLRTTELLDSVEKPVPTLLSIAGLKGLLGKWQEFVRGGFFENLSKLFAPEGEVLPAKFVAPMRKIHSVKGLFGANIVEPILEELNAMSAAKLALHEQWPRETFSGVGGQFLVKNYGRKMLKNAANEVLRQSKMEEGQLDALRAARIHFEKVYIKAYLIRENFGSLKNVVESLQNGGGDSKNYITDYEKKVATFNEWSVKMAKMAKQGKNLAIKLPTKEFTAKDILTYKREIEVILRQPKIDWAELAESGGDDAKFEGIVSSKFNMENQGMVVHRELLKDIAPLLAVEDDGGKQ